jgi:5-methyltetrahydropteroyltriglutamate--homocysteine methyltransferase
MITSTDRILTTHVGSLPRPADLDELLYARDNHQPYDADVLAARVHEVTAQVVDAQIGSGIDLVCDGEVGKIGYSTYVKERLSGFDGEASAIVHREMMEYPGTMGKIAEPLSKMSLPACNGPVSLTDPDAVHRDIAEFKAAVSASAADRQPTGLFMTAASPGVIATFLPNQYYPTHEEYLFALADAMKPEYDAIAAAGLTLQVDCPDLAMTRMMGDNVELTDEEYLEQGRLHVRAINHALRDIPAEQMRLHLCWGNGAWPHIYDIPMRAVVDVALEARPAGLSFEMANPAHAHEWQVWEDVKLPEGKVLIPGVLDSCTNYVEHPQLVAQRLVALAKLVGRENVIAGTDCGFGTFAGLYSVDPPVTWLKFRAMAEGARIASERLW